MTAPSLRFSSCTDIVCDRQISVGAISSGNGNSVNSEGFVSLRSITYHEAEFSADRLSHVQDVPRSRSIDRTATQNNDRRNSIDISDPACYPPGRLNGKQERTLSLGHLKMLSPRPDTELDEMARLHKLYRPP